MTQIISVVNQKGGVGKTTTTVSLAAFIGKKRKKVLMIDLDPQGNATSGLGIDKSEIEKRHVQRLRLCIGASVTKSMPWPKT